jgi:hypothetical protein
MAHADLWILICAPLEFLTVKYGKITKRPKTESGENSKQKFPSDKAATAAWVSKLYSTNSEDGGVTSVSRQINCGLHCVTEKFGPNGSASDLYSGNTLFEIRQGHRLS